MTYVDSVRSVLFPLAASLALGCGVSPAADVPVAPPPPPPAARPHKTGKLLVHDFREGLLLCGAEPGGAGTCRTLPIDLTDRKEVRQHRPGTYLAGTTSGIAAWSPVSNQLRPLDVPMRGVRDPLGISDFVAYVLDDGGMVRFVHEPTRSRVLYRAPGAAAFRLATEYDRFRAYEHRFLPDGRHLFKHTSQMGGKESPHFIDVVLGDTTSLHFVESVGGKQVKLATGDQFMSADFVAGGERIAYFRPGAVDEASNVRRLHLESIVVATRERRAHATVETPVRVTRAAPDATFFLASPWVLHAMQHGPDGKARSLRLQDVASGEHHDRALAPGEELVPTFPGGGDIGWGGYHHRSWGGAVAICAAPRSYGARRTCRVEELPTFTLLFTVELPGNVDAADWIEG